MAGNTAAVAASKLALAAEQRCREEKAEGARKKHEEALRALAEAERVAREEADAKLRAEDAARAREARVALRAANLDPQRPDAAALKKNMDSSIKRNTALIKKLGRITEEGRAGIIDDLRKVNISKYVTEAVAAAVESRLRAADVPAAVEVISTLHQTYPDFAGPLAEALPRFICPGAKAFAPSAAAALAAAAAAAAALTADGHGGTPAEVP